MHDDERARLTGGTVTQAKSDTTSGDECYSEAPLSGAELDRIIAELDVDCSDGLPLEALRAALRHPRQITPRLVGLLRKATQRVRAGEWPANDGHWIALFLLWHFKATTALEAVVEAFSLEGEGPFDLFGDFITEESFRVLATLAGDTPEVLDRLIADPRVNQFVRWEAGYTYLLLVRDGKMSRQQAVERLRGHLVKAIAWRDRETATGLVANLCELGPVEARQEIEDAIRQGADDYIDLDGLAELMERSEEEFQKSLARCPPSDLDDVVSEIESWLITDDDVVPRQIWLDDEVANEADDVDDPYLDNDPWLPAETIRNSTARVGLNDPCPCGSGKKFKKCCGGRGREVRGE